VTPFSRVLSRDFFSMADSAIFEVFSAINLVPKKQQIVVINEIIKKNHVFVNLPTGFGKSAMYALCPLVMDKVNLDCQKIYYLLLLYYRRTWMWDIN